MDAINSRHSSDGTVMRRATPSSTEFQAAIRALRAELDAHSVDPTRDGHLGQALRLVATRARTDGIQPEHLIIAFRQLWDGEPPVLPREAASIRDALRWRLVSALISGYYDNASTALESPA